MYSGPEIHGFSPVGSQYGNFCPVPRFFPTAAAAHAIAILRPCHLLKLMTPEQIILPPFWLHAWECVLKSGSIPSISPPVTGTGDLSDDDFL